MNFFFSSRRRHTFFFQAEDGIRDRSPSRGLGDVYKRQPTKMIQNNKMTQLNGRLNADFTAIVLIQSSLFIDNVIIRP